MKCNVKNSALKWRRTMKKKFVSAEQRKELSRPCVIDIQQRSPGSFIQWFLGPHKWGEAENWLKRSGFTQHRPNLWFQSRPIKMDFCGSEIDLKGAEAWVHSLQTPRQVKFKLGSDEPEC
jgi:hypothetical protein